tara:strand:- start:205 stop:519 length:315 start_codon:yes stop_codon:yes gene_type:complete
MIPKQLTIDEASEILGIRPNSIRAMCKAGQIKHRRIGPRGWMYRFEMAWLEEYLESTIFEMKTKKSRPVKQIKNTKHRSTSPVRPKTPADFKAEMKALRATQGR